MKLWHIGLAVPDLASAQNQFSELWDLTWRPVVTRELSVGQPGADPIRVSCDVTFSLGGPFAIELWRSIPGTPLETPASGWLHHVGYWVDNFEAEGERLDRLGHQPVLTREGWPLLNRGPGNLLIEPCDLHRDQPYIRDLFPQESEHAGAAVVGGERKDQA